MSKGKSGPPKTNEQIESTQKDSTQGQGTQVVEATGESPGGAGVGSDVRPARPAEGRFEGHRAATVNLPFLTAQVRLPDVRVPNLRVPNLRVPNRRDLDAAAHGVQRNLPSGKALLFYGGLTATAVLGAIEWPVAAAIGVGSALASRGGADPRPQRTDQGDASRPS